MTTNYSHPTIYDQQRWGDQGLCIYCGLDSDDKCRCRWCDSCSQMWLANTLAPYADTDRGPKPRTEDCPDCVAWVAAGCPKECTALVKYDPRFHVFDWSTVADAAEVAFYNTIKKVDRQYRDTLLAVREATHLITELNRSLSGY